MHKPLERDRITVAIKMQKLLCNVKLPDNERNFLGNARFKEKPEERKPGSI